MPIKKTITRKTRGLGYAYSPFEIPDKPIYEGTVRQVLQQLDDDGNRRVLASGGIAVHSHWFLDGKRIVLLDGYAEPNWFTAGFRDLNSMWLRSIEVEVED